MKTLNYSVLREAQWGRVALLATLAVGLIATAGGFYLKFVTAAGRKDATDNLAAVAKSKIGEIENWHTERLSDGNMVMENPCLAEAVARWLANPEATNAEPLLIQFRSLQRHRHYSDVLLVDADGQVRLSLSGRHDRLHDVTATALASVLSDRRVLLTDLLAGVGKLPPRMNVVVPVAATHAEVVEQRSAIILEADASEFLFPLIQAWPSASPSAETLLIRREGDEVLYLNELRHRKGTALALRLPLGDKALPAARALGGETGVIAGVDYRGVPVLAWVYAVAGTKWFMVAKVDQEEIDAPVRRQTLLIVASMGLAMLVIGLGGRLFWWQQRARRYRDKEEAVRASEVRYRRLFEAARDGVLIVDAETGKVEDVNPFLIELLGVTREVFLGKKVWELGLLKDVVANEANFEELKTKQYIRYDDMALEGHDGRRHEVEFISNVYLVDGKKVIQCNIRDISERKVAEEQLRKQAEQLQARNEELLRLNHLMVGRELRVIELKQQANDLAAQLGQPRPYLLAFVDAAAVEILRAAPKPGETEAKVGSQRSEVGSQRSEVERQKSADIETRKEQAP